MTSTPTPDHHHPAPDLLPVRGRVMGTLADVVVRGPSPTPRTVLDHLEHLERRWSRFDPDSEVSRLGRLGPRGGVAVASPETALLVDRSVTAWALTGGRFDPTVLDALEAAGYDRSFDELPEVVRRGPATGPAPGCAGLRVDLTGGVITVPAGVRLDPGGIGKGLAADLAAETALERGAHGVLVSVGGDLRVGGDPPAEGWEIEVDHHVVPAARVNLRAGALATSTVLRRRWHTPDGPAHHVIDPCTGAPVRSSALAVSVVAAEAWWAEALATALLVDGGPVEGGLMDRTPAGWLGEVGVLVTTVEGEQIRTGPLGSAFSTQEVPA